METQKIVNLPSGSDNESSRFATRKWNIINDQNNVQYGRGDEDENDSTIKFERKVIKPNLKIANIAANTNLAFRNCAPFTGCVTHINDEHVETAEDLDIIMPMYNLIEYLDNYADSSGSLYQFKREESLMNNAGNPLNVALDNSASFK